MSMRIESLLMSPYKNSHLQLDALKQHILSDGKECLNIISHKLGENTFVFENR